LMQSRSLRKRHRWKTCSSRLKTGTIESWPLPCRHRQVWWLFPVVTLYSLISEKGVYYKRKSIT
jgi:hypothetical protein